MNELSDNGRNKSPVVGRIIKNVVDKLGNGDKRTETIVGFIPFVTVHASIFKVRTVSLPVHRFPYLQI